MEISPNTAHIWLVNLDEVVLTDSVLTSDELERANKMHSPEHRHRTMAARYVLRMLLKQYTAEVKVRPTDRGKLYLPDSDLKFNLAHSGQYAIYAFTHNIEVGIDIEQPRENIEFAGIAKRIMSEAEYHYWSQLEPEQQRVVFFQIWTRKEAFIKCTGEGLAAALKAINTLPGASNTPPLFLQDLTNFNHCFCALASEKSVIVNYFYWNCMI